MEQTAATEVIDDASLPFLSAERNRQPGVLMLTKPHWQTHTHAARRYRWAADMGQQLH